MRREARGDLQPLLLAAGRRWPASRAPAGLSDAALRRRQRCQRGPLSGAPRHRRAWPAGPPGARTAAAPAPGQPTRQRRRGTARSRRCRCSWHAAQSRGVLQELDEPGVAVGRRAAGRRPAARRRSRRRRRSAPCVVQVLDQHQAGHQRHQRQQPRPSCSHQPWPPPSSAAPPPGRRRHAPRRRCARPRAALERLLAREAQALGDVGATVSARSFSRGGDPAARSAPRGRLDRWRSMAAFECRSRCDSLCPQRLGQGMHGPGAVRLDAALRATHDRRRLGHIEFLPVTQQEGFSLTRRQLRQPLPRSASRIWPATPSPPHSRCRANRPAASSVSSRSKSPSSSPATRSPRSSARRALRTFWRRNQSIVALDRMRWNSSGSSAGGPVGVLLGQPDHRVLHDVERRIVVAHGIDRALEGALLDALEEVGEFFVGGQGRGASGRGPERRRGLCHRTASGRPRGRSVCKQVS